MGVGVTVIEVAVPPLNLKENGKNIMKQKKKKKRKKREKQLYVL